MKYVRLVNNWTTLLILLFLLMENIMPVQNNQTTIWIQIKIPRKEYDSWVRGIIKKENG